MTTPDSLGGDIANPQSLNRYAYVTNNPASFNDPSGLSEIYIGAGSEDRRLCGPRFLFSNPCSFVRRQQHAVDGQDGMAGGLFLE